MIQSKKSFILIVTFLLLVLTSNQTKISQFVIEDAFSKTKPEIVNHIHSTYKIPEKQAKQIVRHVFNVAHQYDISPYLLLGIIAVESSFRPNARSRKGAQGLMQVIPRFHPDIVRQQGGPSNIYDIEKNIKIGTLILKKYMAEHKSVESALLKYNGSLHSRNKTYSRKVLQKRNQYKRITIQG